ncbi:MAG TPA: VWA domain-containing protein, partial [Phycisphaerae bacterium]|nr:VWA domain-containing protein [Phycisphaerae bacterium]
LTDGENNRGDIMPLKAAELAKSHGIKIYTIGVGTKGMAPVPVIDPFTGQTVIRLAKVDIDEKTLKEIARLTGGEYFRATDTKSLEKIYATIDKLEKTVIEQKKYAEYRELALKPFRIGGYMFPPLLLVAFVVLGLEALLANTWLRKVP